MADDSLILEHLKSIQTTLARHGEQLAMLIQRVGILEQNMSSISVRIDRIDARLERVEHRLDLLPAE